MSAESNPSVSNELLQGHVSALWNKGDLRGLLLPHQVGPYDHFYDNKFKKTVWLCSRRFGKSAGFIILAIEACLRKDGAKVRYGASTQKMVEEIIVPIIHILMEILPLEIRPQWVPSRSKLLFPTRPNSHVVISGVDEGRADRLRGTDMDLGLIDESQDINDIDYVVRDVLMPQTLTTRGRIILGGTRPKTSAHPFTEYIRSAERDGALIRRTIYDDSRPEIIEQIPDLIKEAGGERSTTWRREYLVEEVTDQESAIIPEFSEREVRERVVRSNPRPPHFIAYTVVDLGLIDFTAAVFGYVDFLKGKKVIIGEFLVNRKDSRFIADSITTIEKKIWGENFSVNNKIRRFVDGQALTVMDFNSIHGFACSMVAKDNLDAMTNELRLDCVSGKLQIDPSCQDTIKHIQYGLWDRSHNKFDRSSTYGHYDLLAAAMYFIRHVNMRENPYPSDYGLALETHLIRDDNGEKTYTQKAIKSAFKL